MFTIVAATPRETAPLSTAIKDWIAAAPDFLIGATFFVLWVEPEFLGITRIRDGVLLMLMEFIVIHSAGIMGAVAWADTPAPRKALQMLGLGLLYTVAAAGFALGFKTWWPLLGFWGLTINHLLGALLDPGSAGERQLVQATWAVTAVLYLGAAFASVLIPWPRLGVTPAVLEQVALPSSGAWIEQPWDVMATGFLYFTACGVWQLNAGVWFRRSLGSVPHRGA